MPTFDHVDIGGLEEMLRRIRDIQHAADEAKESLEAMNAELDRVPDKARDAEDAIRRVPDLGEDEG